MARQSSGRRNAEDEPDLDVLDETEVVDVEEADEDDGEVERDTQTEALWADVRIDPVELSLPTGTGYTLRAYRLASELTPTELDDEEEDPFARLQRRPTTDEDDEDDTTVDFDDDFAERVRSTDDSADQEPLSADELDDEDAEAAAEEAESEEEVPAFLTHRGKLLVFHTPEALVEFVKSGAEHDLAQLDSWPDLVERLQVKDVVPTPEDTYELDLLVENLRGGHDAWDAGLIIGAGEVARDLAYALRMEALMTALSPGSPLDDLDEALRSAEAGGVGGFLAKRRVRKIGIQQATLGWRTIIGKISGAVVWRE